MCFSYRLTRLCWNATDHIYTASFPSLANRDNLIAVQKIGLLDTFARATSWDRVGGIVMDWPQFRRQLESVANQRPTVDTAVKVKWRE